jgi:Spy/CpxP family protein refolding chaperone
MNDDMPWVDLTPEEIQELRTKKHELTEYGKQKIRELMTHEEMLEEAERRELINEALEELNAIVLGGQNTREFYLSISHIRNVLERLK